MRNEPVGQLTDDIITGQRRYWGVTKNRPHTLCVVWLGDYVLTRGAQFLVQFGQFIQYFPRTNRISISAPSPTNLRAGAPVQLHIVLYDLSSPHLWHTVIRYNK
jgi:hypothetical protein